MSANYDPRIEAEGHHLCHVLGENRGGEMSDKDRHDIFSTVRSVADYWREDSEKLRKENHAKRWNELRIWLRENPTATTKDVSAIMLHLDASDYVRDIRVK